VELWDILNRQGEKTGKTIVRGERLRFGQYHLVVHIWVADDSGRLLIQRRAPDLAVLPGKWAATGGSAVSGEDSETAARRELFEELGIDAAAGEMEHIKRLLRSNSFADLWLLRRNVALEELALQEEEVAEVKWVTRAGMADMVNARSFHNYGKWYFDALFESVYRDQRGAGL